MAAAGSVKRTLPNELPSRLRLPNGFADPAICLPGILAVTSPPWTAEPHGADPAPSRFCGAFDVTDSINQFPIILLVDDASFCASSLANFLWVTFTRSDPASDLYGIGSFTKQKHWGCVGSLVIDARVKSHMAPPLEADPKISAQVDRLFSVGGSLHGIA